MSPQRKCKHHRKEAPAMRTRPNAVGRSMRQPVPAQHHGRRQTPPCGPPRPSGPAKPARENSCWRWQLRKAAGNLAVLVSLESSSTAAEERVRCDSARISSSEVRVEIRSDPETPILTRRPATLVHGPFPAGMRFRARVTATSASRRLRRLVGRSSRAIRFSSNRSCAWRRRSPRPPREPSSPR